MTQLLETKSLLAKLMATENLHIEQRKVSTASFDVKNRILTVPVLNNDIDANTYDLFMGHEVGHALYTPADEMAQAAEDGENMSIINVIEDSRIERKIKYKYPGLKNSFILAYRGLYNRDFFKTQDEDLDELNFIDRINLHCKVGAILNITFTEEERELLHEVENTQTYKEVVELQRKIVDYMKSQIEPEEDNFDEYEPTFEDFDPESENEDGEDDKGEDKDDTGVNTEESKEEKGDVEEQKSPKDEKEGEFLNRGKKKGAGKSETEISEEEIRSFTDDAYKENEHRLFSYEGGESYYVKVPKMDMDRIIIDYKVLYEMHKKESARAYNHVGPVNVNDYIEIRNSLKNSVSYLVKEFELKKNAEQMKKASTSKTGDLNLNKIFSYKFNEDIFKKITVVPNGQSHGLVIFIDWSGSMQDHLFNTVKQLFSIVLFCKKVNIPYEVYAFSDRSEVVHNLIQKNKPNSMYLNQTFKLMNILSSRMSASEFTSAASNLVWICNNIQYCTTFALSGTPLHETVIAAMDIIPAFQKKHKLQIVNTVFLTDGESNSEGQVNVFDSRGYGTTVPPTTYTRAKGYVRNNVILVDPVTKHEVKLNDICTNITTSLIKLLKYRTGCNVIGFYILNLREAKYVMTNKYYSGVDVSDKITEFKRNKHAVVTNQGYDEYYLLKSDIDVMDEEFVCTTKTTRGIVSAFSKYSGNKTNNRVVLNRFIGLIS